MLLNSIFLLPTPIFLLLNSNFLYLNSIFLATQLKFSCHSNQISYRSIISQLKFTKNSSFLISFFVTMSTEVFL